MLQMDYAVSKERFFMRFLFTVMLQLHQDDIQSCLQPHLWTL